MACSETDEAGRGSDQLEPYTSGRGVWSGGLQHTEKYQSEAFFISLPDEQQTAEKLAHSSLWLQSIFSPRLLAVRTDRLLKQPPSCTSSKATSQCAPRAALASCSPTAHHHSHVSSQKTSGREASCLVAATFPSKDDGAKGR